MQAFRPRIIYCPLFAWNAITGGKFIAPLLQQISPTFSDATVGMTLAIQYSMVAILAGWGGRLADGEERKVRKIQRKGSTTVWGRGRLKVTSWGLFIGTMAFLGHELPRYFLLLDSDILPDSNGIANNPQNDGGMSWNFELLWHIFMRMLWAASFAHTAPSMDGLVLDHLDCIEDASQMDFGTERMYGAFWWGIGSLIAGMGIDRYGAGFLYVMAVLCALATYCGIGLYLWGLRRDTTGSFEMRGVAIEYDDDCDDAELIQHGMVQVDVLSDSRTNNENGGNNQSTKYEEKISSWELFLMLCQTYYGVALVLFIFTFATGISVVDNLAFLFFDFLGSSSTMDGLTVVFSVVFEVPLFFMSPYLLKRYGPGKLLLAAGLAYIIRVVGYTLVPMGGMWIILPLETLHGISYACSKTGSVEFVARIMPKGYEASGQGILFVLRFIGVVVGLGSAGWTQEVYGPRIMYGVMACVVSFGWVVLLIAEVWNEGLKGGEENGQVDSDGSSEPYEKDGLIKPELALADGKLKYGSMT